MATIDDFLKLDIRAGAIMEAKIFARALKPAYQLKIDFGVEIGEKKSSARITDRYAPEDLIGSTRVFQDGKHPAIFCQNGRKWLKEYACKCQG